MSRRRHKSACHGIALAAVALALAGPANASVNDFRLPAEPSDANRPQGPETDNGAAPRAATPTPSPTPTPTPRAVTPTPAPVLRLPPIQPQPTPTRNAAATPSPTPTASRTAAPATQGQPQAEPTPEATATAPTPQPETPRVTASSAAPSPAATPPSTSATEDDGGGLAWYLWLPALLALALGLVIAFISLRERRKLDAYRSGIAAPLVERPDLTRVRAPQAEPDAQAAGAAGEASSQAMPAAPIIGATTLKSLELSLDPRRLSLTLMAATLSYTLTLTNRSNRRIHGIAVGADLVSAHASLPQDKLIAGPRSKIDIRHEIDTLEPGESIELTGDLRLPNSQMAAINRGNAVLFVPLARFVARAGLDTATLTAVVGNVSPTGSGVLPVRLDLGPRIYNGLASRSF